MLGLFKSKHTDRVMFRKQATVYIHISRMQEKMCGFGVV